MTEGPIQPRADDTRFPYYDRQGKRIGFAEWANRKQGSVDENGVYGDESYLRVAITKIQGLVVSTVWIGLDMGFGWPSGQHPPVIFETMVFGGPEWRETETKPNRFDLQEFGSYTSRYATEEAALAGHDQVVAEIRAALPQVPDSPAEILAAPEADC